MHWHAYTWTGNGADRAREAERRPGSADFTTSLLPPMRTGDWLAKPRSRVAGTFDSVAKAVDWMAVEFGLVDELLLHPDRIGLAWRVQCAADVLPRGVDVQWGEWLQGGRFVSVAMVCCPNRHVGHPCPTR